MSVDVQPGYDEANQQYEHYRALSTAAVGSLIVGVMSAAAILSWFLVCVPLIGAALSLYALVNLNRRSDELTGAALARAGLALSLLFLVAGPAWLTYEYATELPPGYARVSYTDLQPDPTQAGQQVPPSALDLEGKKIFIKGYVYPGREKDGIRQFLLVRDQGDCCFGGNPRITDRIQVTLVDPLAAQVSIAAAQGRRNVSRFAADHRDRRCPRGRALPPRSGLFEMTRALAIASLFVVIAALAVYKLASSPSDQGQPASQQATAAEPSKAATEASAQVGAKPSDQAKPDGEPAATADKSASDKPAAPAVPVTQTADSSEPAKDVTFDDVKLELKKGDPYDSSLLTDKVKKLDGKSIRIRGYILPSFQQSNIKQFVLVRDNMECCFGPGALLHDCIIVEMTPPATATFHTRPVSVEGVFSIRELKLDGKYLAIYHLDGKDVKSAPRGARAWRRWRSPADWPRSSACPLPREPARSARRWRRRSASCASGPP